MCEQRRETRWFSPICNSSMSRGCADVPTWAVQADTSRWQGSKACARIGVVRAKTAPPTGSRRI